ncbi:MAG: Mur ligase, partial [Gammaproteobacteria bacterium]|nr:Mur ligase [Gammaproteobacteria bacterium]
MDIPYPDTKKLILDDCRRITGPSLVLDGPGATLDILVEDIPMDLVLECWYRTVRDMLDLLGWQQRRLNHRQFENGFNLVIEAPVDQLYSATLVLETAWYFITCELLNIKVEHREALIQTIRQSVSDESNPGLIALQQAATKRQVDFLVDDDEVSIGHGADSICYPIDQIPAPDTIDWSTIHNLPVALITGTNGKSTSVRILDGIAKAAGQVSGVTSTDFVRVGDDVLDQGDYSGPGGARLLLRDRRLQVAFLEVARGGILRRGLPLRRAQAALVTNVARDHLGQYGVNTLEALTEVKFVVSKGLADDGVLVVNADDPGMLTYLQTIAPPNLCLFSLDKNNKAVQQQILNLLPCCYCENQQLIYYDGSETTAICHIADIPMTMAGAALHNVRNALGAIGVAMVMGYSPQQVKAGLSEFRSNEYDNPGRLNSFKLKNGASVLVDFAHNAHSVTAVVDTVGRMPARTKWAMFGSAGDRSDHEIAAIATG